MIDFPLLSLSLLSSVAVGGFEEMAGDQMKLRSGWPQVFFAMPELVSVIAEQRVVLFQYFSLTLELCPQLTKWYGYYFCNLSPFKPLDWLPAGGFAASLMQKVDNWGRLVPLQSTNPYTFCISGITIWCRGSILTFHWAGEWIGNSKENHGQPVNCHISWKYNAASLSPFCRSLLSTAYRTQITISVVWLLKQD